ncbi:hypothetical protein [Deinococcus marmoris]|uniref:PEGA domain-containing protein n=1 Tax=Deinococcus marmoris TaxID=249408 RepID=A0A1U7NYI6_9DEIO|nr:hypothetical protein [Deinococcus marmoris]OLV17979.1 hypothetical protein BOO71_0006994 [Deinococcus marmoris]
MKPIGPYVAVQALPPPANGVAAADSPIQTFRATDRLTGIPVLLHVLPYAQGLPEVPFSPHLLPVVDSGVDGEQAYLVTELPLQAHPAQDPELAARGALAALSALHERGMTHGGVSGAQLWNHDGGVALAGAGLPWREDATPQGDLSDLALTLQALGALPEALRPLLQQPGSLSAHGALALLGGDVAEQKQKTAGQQEAAVELPLDQPAALGQPSEEKNAAAIMSGPSSSEVSGGQSAVPPSSPVELAPVPSGKNGASSPSGTEGGGIDGEGSAVGSAQTETAMPASEQGQTSVVSPFSNAPTGQSETPQERRRRQNDERQEQAALDSQAAAERRAAYLKEQSEQEMREIAQAAELAARGVPVPEPFQMGFAADSTDNVGGAVPGLQTRQVERLPASLRRPGGEALDGTGTVQRLPSSASAAGTPARRDLPPIRIGWDEDDSWRVVRTAPKSSQPSPLLRWVPLALVVIVLLGAALLWALRPARAASTAAGSAALGAPCCNVDFTLRGAAGVTAQLNVVSAPASAKLAANQTLGLAPGKVNFPVQGTYQLNVVAEGYRSAPLTVTVPRTQPVTIDLGN